MTKCVVVTAAETNYFELLKDWLASFAAFPELGDLELCVLDIGLDPAQAEWLKTQGTRTIKPDWNVDVQHLPDTPNYYKAMTARPFLPRYFPNYDIIAWFDADIWVQIPSSVRHYLIGAERYGFVLTPEIDRAYGLLYGEYNPIRLMHHGFYYQLFGRLIADELIQFPIMNSGAFAARTNHPIWAAWQKTCAQTMKVARLKHSEQAALNLAIYQNLALRPHLLPATANWICALAEPMWDPERKKLVEPFLPHDVLGLVHLTRQQAQVRLRTTAGGEVTASLTYRGICALADKS